MLKNIKLLEKNHGILIRILSKSVGDSVEIFLIAGHFHNIVRDYLHKDLYVINVEQVNLENAVNYIEHTKKKLGGVLITDEGINELGLQTRDILLEFINFIEKNITPNLPIIVLSRNYLLGEILHKFSVGRNLRIIVSDSTRIPLLAYEKVYSEFMGLETKKEQSLKRETKQELPNKSFSFFARFRQKKNSDDEIKATDDLAKKYGLISKSISRVIIITGHRGSGLTSTTVNTAFTAHMRGLSTIIVDMDVKYRSTNLYFGTFHQNAQRDEEVAGSLIRCLARPQNYKTTAFNIKDNLWLTTLAYSFNDKRLIDQFYTGLKFISMISVLRQKFNLVIIDMPIDLLGIYSESLIHVDVFGLCIPNNLYAILSTLRNINSVLNKESMAYLNAKSKLIVTKYNDRARIQGEIFTPDKVCQLLASDLSDNFNIQIPLAGYVPYSFDFDAQVETDVPIVNANMEYERAYANILLRLMEGVM
ncbi:MAG: hypothetical protein M0Z31_05760 [Clostridia bacterium]|nr:hypothetical protein [Clostridia bacterium]